MREWCINTAAVDPLDQLGPGQQRGRQAVPLESDDATRWRRAITLSPGVGEAYTPTVIGPDGTVYAINWAILNAVGQSALSINDVLVTERNRGTHAATFTVTLSPASTQTVSVSWATSNGTAVAGTDYTAAAGILSFAPGATSRTLSVAVTGDKTSEANETFSVSLSNATGATLTDAIGQATIVDDDPLPSLSIQDKSRKEGNSGTRTLLFTVKLSAASGQPVSVPYATANGTARVAAQRLRGRQRRAHLPYRDNQPDDSDHRDLGHRQGEQRDVLRPPREAVEGDHRAQARPGDHQQRRSLSRRPLLTVPARQPPCRECARSPGTAAGSTRGRLRRSAESTIGTSSSGERLPSPAAVAQLLDECNKLLAAVLSG